LAQKKAKIGRPKLPKGAAKGRIVPIRFSDEEIKLMTIAARAMKQSVSEVVRQAVWSAFSWVVSCKKCGREFAFSNIDELHPRQVVNNMPTSTPPKPPLNNGAEERTCPHCNSISTYKRGDLRFKAN
jgi:hypothetical protein